MYQSIFSDELFMDAKYALPIIKEWGSDYVDLRGMVNGKAIEEQTDEELHALKAQLDELGLKVAVIQSSLCKVHLPDEERQKKEEEKLEGLIRACEILDCKLVRAFFYWQAYEDNPELYGQLAVRPDLMKDVLTRFAPIKKRALEAGLTIGFENCGVTWQEVLAFLGAIDVPEWGIAWDPFNDFGNVPEDKVTDCILQCLDKSVMLHAKAASIVDGIKHVNVPWKRILRGAAATGKVLPVSVETHNPQNSPYTHEEATRLCYEAIREVWPAAPVNSSVAEAVAETDDDIYPACPFADDPVRIVVVGLGMGAFRCRQILKNPSTKLMGICDLNLEKAKKYAEEFGVPYSDDINVFLNDPEVEVMYVVTPTGLHCSVAEQCLHAGKHVLMTKPMDVTTENCESAIRLAKEKGLHLGVDFDVRHGIELPELVQAVKKGWFGRILSANMSLYVKRTQDYYDENGAWRGTWRYDGGGAMCNQGVHEVDFLQEVFGMPDMVRGSIATQAHVIQTEDLGWTEWKYEDGCVVRFYATTNYPVDAWYVKFEVHGTSGAYVNVSGGPEGNHVWWGKANDGWTEKAPYPCKPVWRCGSDHFAHIVRLNSENNISGEIGKRSRIILDAVYKSAQNGSEWIKLTGEK